MAQKRAYEQVSSPTDGPGKSQGQPALKISRKIRACKECQSRKIRCDMGPGERVCSRCQRLNLNCVVNKSLQTLLEDENEWKNGVDQQLNQIRYAVSELLRRNHLPDLVGFSPGAGSTTPSLPPDSRAESILDPGLRGKLESHISPHADKPSPHPSAAPTSAPVMAMTRENSQEPQAPEEEGVVAAPMASLFEVTKLRNLRSNVDGRRTDVSPMDNDFISQGRISEQAAGELFTVFKKSLNEYLWGGIALVHDNLKSVRNSSSQLLAAILAVTALHIRDAENVFDICYTEFLNLVSSSMFDRYHTLDDVRGLCIGAFWLSDVSWKLSGHAVRIATELNLHQSFARAMRGSDKEIDRARLWYLLYVCDHHFSIAYGRPPVTHENEAITHHEMFLGLGSPRITESDVRLQSQVGVFKILSRIFQEFGTDSANTLSEEQLESVGKYNSDLDTWRTHWESRLKQNDFIGDYPARGVILHCHFAKVQLNALVLRGFQFTAESMSANRQHYANLAISSAIRTLEVVLNEPHVRQSVVGVPLYLTTLISLSTLFLLKVQLTWKNLRLNVNGPVVMDLLERIVLLLQEAKASHRHLAPHIAQGLGNMLAKFKSSQMHGAAEQGPPMLVHPQSLPPIQDTGSWQQVHMGNAMYGDIMSMYGLDEQYFPLGIFDALPAQMPS